MQQRLDPITIRRVEQLRLRKDARCLDMGGGRGSIASWLAEQVVPDGEVVVTDLDTGFLDRLDLPNLKVRRHDIRTDDFPQNSFDFVHTRAVLMHVRDRMRVLTKMVSWLKPNGWLLVEEPDFGMWISDFDPIWSAHPSAWHEAFPDGSLSQGRALLRQIHQLGLQDVGADAELDIVQPGTPLADFYRLSMAAVAEPLIAAGLLTPDEAHDLTTRPEAHDFLGCGFAHIGSWGKKSSAA